MKLLDALVEQRIAAAAARGEFDELPGAGAPLSLDDDALVPEEVRVANRILKNAGFVPPAVEQLRALRDLQAELNAVSDQATRCRLQARMLALDMALESLRGGPLVLPRANTAGALPSGCPSAPATSIRQTRVRSERAACPRRRAGFGFCRVSRRAECAGFSGLSRWCR